MKLHDRLIFGKLWNSERVGGLSHWPFRVYKGLLQLCDDVGLFECNTPAIHGLLFSTTPDTRLADVKSALDAIESAKLVRFYEVRGKRYGCLWNWRQRLKNPSQECPQPPPEILAWQASSDPPSLNRREQNRTEQKGSEGEQNPHAGGGVVITPETLTAYAWAHCGLNPREPRFTLKEAAALLKNVGGKHDTSAVKALEYFAAQDPRYRWTDPKVPVAVLTALAKDHRDGLKTLQPEGPLTTFAQWQARQA